MKVITEIDLRDKYKNEPFDTYTLVYPQRFTPSALQFLSERKIKIIEINEGQNGTPDEASKNNNSSQKSFVTIPIKEPDKGYLLLDSKEVVQEKPEEYTHLKGKSLVPKSHKRIRFRGQLDKLEAVFIDTIIEVQSSGFRELISDLTLIFEYTKKIMRAEVLEEELPFIDFKGWSDKDIREYSHYPDKYFGVKHVSPDPRYGKIVAKLNLLRVQIRELEITAVETFFSGEASLNEGNSNKDESKIKGRADIILALNRMRLMVIAPQLHYFPLKLLFLHLKLQLNVLQM